MNMVLKTLYHRVNGINNKILKINKNYIVKQDDNLLFECSNLLLDKLCLLEKIQEKSGGDEANTKIEYCKKEIQSLYEGLPHLENKRDEKKLVSILDVDYPDELYEIDESLALGYKPFLWDRFKNNFKKYFKFFYKK